jgi:ribonuclease VapC
MVTHTSALLAILSAEPETEAFARARADDPKNKIGAFNALDCAIVIEAKKGEAGGREPDLLLHRARIAITALNPAHVEPAPAAWRKFGEGNHPAGLHIGGCCAYALAKYAGEPLLFKGEDFRRTDVPPAIENQVEDRTSRGRPHVNEHMIPASRRSVPMHDLPRGQDDIENTVVPGDDFFGLQPVERIDV